MTNGEREWTIGTEEEERQLCFGFQHGLPDLDQEAEIGEQNKLIRRCMLAGPRVQRGRGRAGRGDV